jgi:hypothetical protein
MGDSKSFMLQPLHHWGKKTAVATEKKAGWAPQPIGTLRRIKAYIGTPLFNYKILCFPHLSVSSRQYHFITLQNQPPLSTKIQNYKAYCAAGVKTSLLAIRTRKIS